MNNSFPSKEQKEARPLLNRRYDLTGNGIVSVIRHQLMAKWVPLGNYRGGAGFRCLSVLFLLHYFGRPLFFFLIRFEKQMISLHTLRQRLTSKIGKNN